VAGTPYVGTSGFAYPEWKGTFYPATIRQKDMLSYYAERFGSVEINYTFRKDPTEEVLARWCASVPDSFVFALKAPQRVTHWMRLAGAGEVASAFLRKAGTLGDRLGPVLFQCPPTLPFDGPLLEAFLADVPAGFRIAFEFRHPSWTQTRPMLRSKGVAWCHAETDQQPTSEWEGTNEPFLYLRMRRTAYPAGAMRIWADRIGSALAQDLDVFCYFKHEERGAGPAFARRLLGLTESAPSASANTTPSGSAIRVPTPPWSVSPPTP